ncbi:MAG: hypothetical protein J7647_01945 [Cyanobacteria bacterium SBLK]|nr:hypothetical protein [Cyanobacteria bacterium SBLK]
MEISLLSRFEGGLLGSTMALELPEIDSTFAFWKKIQNGAIATLIETGKLETQDWWQQIDRDDRPSLECQKTGTSSEVAAMALPIILFFHDIPLQLNAELSRIASLWLHPEEPIEDILLWGEAIALILQENFNPSQFLPQLISRSPPRESLLNALQDAIERGLSLQQTARTIADRPLSQTEIALALYCFSFTPEDFSLCWHRSQQFNPLAAILTGAIAGVYNSSLGFPPSWCLSPQRQQILEKARWLFSAWSGCYILDNRDRLPRTAIGAAGTIQARKGFATISQRESRFPSYPTKSRSLNLS